MAVGTRKRPRLTAARVEALSTMAERLRDRVKERAGDGLFTLRREEKRRIAAAIMFVDELVAWKARGTRS